MPLNMFLAVQMYSMSNNSYPFFIYISIKYDYKWTAHLGHTVIKKIGHLYALS